MNAIEQTRALLETCTQRNQEMCQEILDLRRIVREQGEKLSITQSVLVSLLLRHRYPVYRVTKGVLAQNLADDFTLSIENNPHFNEVDVTLLKGEASVFPHQPTAGILVRGEDSTDDDYDENGTPNEINELEIELDELLEDLAGIADAINELLEEAPY